MTIKLEYIKQSAVLLLISTALSLVSLLSLYAPVFADSAEFNFLTGCTATPEGSYTAILDVSSSKDIYAKLGTRGQKLTVSSYQINENLEGGCRKIANIEINGDSWTKIGSLLPGDGRVVLEIYSPELALLPNANRPSVLLIDPTNPVCVPTVECEITHSIDNAYVRSPTTLHDKASLFVGMPQDPSTDVLERVDYYVSNQLAYSKPALEAFDTKYISYGGQKLLRVAHYKSGQEIVYQASAPDNFSDNILNFIYRTFGVNTTISKVILSLLAVFLIIVITYYLMKRYVQHYRWLVYHGMMRRETLGQRIGLYTEILLERVDYALERFYNQRFVVWIRRNKTNIKYVSFFWLIPLILVTVYFSVKNYAFVIYHVNGQSMTNTFQDGQSLFVNRLPQTWARINHQQMDLKRGDVVVVNAIYGLVSAEQIEANQHTIVKRVLGLPGETVSIKNGVVEVYKAGSSVPIKVDQGSPWESTMIKDENGADISLTLASDEIFLSGDNRPGSIDSRLNGPVKVDQIIGVVISH